MTKSRSSGSSGAVLSLDSSVVVSVQPKPPDVNDVASVTRVYPVATGDVLVPKSNLVELGGGGGGGGEPAREIIGFDHRARSPAAGPTARTVRMNLTSWPARELRSTLAR